MSTRYPEHPDEEHATRGSAGSPLLAGMMIGGLLGAGAMLLLAPQSGRKTRQELGEGAMEMRDRTTENVRDAVSQARSRARQMAADVRERATDLENQGKDIAIDQLDRVASAAESGKKSLRDSKGPA